MFNQGLSWMSEWISIWQKNGTPIGPQLNARWNFLNDEVNRINHLFGLYYFLPSFAHWHFLKGLR